MAKYPVRIDLTKIKPKVRAPQNRPAPPITQRDLNRQARMQGEEARSEALLKKHRAPAKDVISVTTRMRETPPKKGR